MDQWDIKHEETALVRRVMKMEKCVMTPRSLVWKMRRMMTELVTGRDGEMRPPGRGGEVMSPVWDPWS